MVRPFRVEQAPGFPGAASAVVRDVETIVQELHDMRRHIAARETADTAIQVWSGIADIQRRIDVTRNEIAALRARGLTHPNGRATNELRAVVAGTEEATNTILAAAETIDDLAQAIMSRDDEDTLDDAQAIAETVVTIYEACNFQDITGQRISKVVASLEFIESRIAGMIDAWRGDDVRTEDPSCGARPCEMQHGPALTSDRDVVTQEEVDALFR